MRFILQDGFWFGHLAFVRMVKFNFSQNFPFLTLSRSSCVWDFVSLSLEISIQLFFLQFLFPSYSCSVDFYVACAATNSNGKCVTAKSFPLVVDSIFQFFMASVKNFMTSFYDRYLQHFRVIYYLALRDYIINLLVINPRYGYIFSTCSTFRGCADQNTIHHMFLLFPYGKFSVLQKADRGLLARNSFFL